MKHTFLAGAALCASLTAGAFAQACGEAETAATCSAKAPGAEVVGPETQDAIAEAKTAARARNQLDLGDVDLKVLFLTIASGEHTSADGNDYAFRAMEIPLVKGTQRDKNAPAESKSTYLDLPLFRLLSLDTTDLVDFDLKLLEIPFAHVLHSESSDRAENLSLFKAGIVTMFDSRQGEEYHRGFGGSEGVGKQWEVARNPLLRLVSGTAAENEHRFGFLTSRSRPATGDNRFALLDTYSRSGADEYSTVRFGETWLFDTFLTEKDGTASRTELIDSAAFSLLRTQVTTDGETDVEFLRLPLKTRVAGFERDSDGSGAFSFMRLPILGSAFRHSTATDDAELKVLFLPLL